MTWQPASLGPVNYLSIITTPPSIHSLRHLFARGVSLLTISPRAATPDLASHQPRAKSNTLPVDYARLATTIIEHNGFPPPFSGHYPSALGVRLLQQKLHRQANLRVPKQDPPPPRFMQATSQPAASQEPFLDGCILPTMERYSTPFGNIQQPGQPQLSDL